MKEREEIESAYERYPDPTLFWCFVDLVNSSNYRIALGPKDGYVRGETFFSLVNGVIAPCSDVRVIKEIGDSVFLAAATIRPLFECMILIDQTAHQLADVAGSLQFPFAVRAAIGFGAAKRLMRRHEDFLGTPIDQLARVMAVRSEVSNLLLQEEAYQPSQDILREYAPFLQVADPKMVSGEASKHQLRPIYYRELIVNRSALVEIRDHFAHWRQQSGVSR